MKKIGLIGGSGPESTLIYYKEINSKINEMSGGTKNGGIEYHDNNA